MPPFLPAAGQGAAAALPYFVRRTSRRLDRRMQAAERAPRGPEQDELLHEVRKDAKRSRHASAVVEPVLARPARRSAAAADMQESLADFQDGVVTRQVLRELGARGARAGENGSPSAGCKPFTGPRRDRRAASRRPARRCPDAACWRWFDE